MEPKFVAIPAAVIIAVIALGSMSLLPQNDPNIAQRESQAEAEIHKLVNIQRVEHGVEPLIYDRDLGKIAKAHSQDMAKQGYFDHSTPNGIKTEDRGRNAGYDCRESTSDDEMSYAVIKETIFIKESESSLVSESPKEFAQETVEWWMNSPEYNTVILDKSLSVDGIGVALNQNKILVTQNFC
ncbi:MAG: hypothetical protein GKS07_10895 [Nitrosopumilus sp.]|nr:MAG: hypothetical protein GKS07_10895 [Nitrosopumilus sp.]